MQRIYQRGELKTLIFNFMESNSEMDLEKAYLIFSETNPCTRGQFVDRAKMWADSKGAELNESTPIQKVSNVNVTSSALKEPDDIITVKLRDQHFDPSLFIPFKTYKGVDKLFSKKGGVMPATVNIVCGEPGAGKTTICSDTLLTVERNLTEEFYKLNKKSVEKQDDHLYISAEMTRIDFASETEENPSLNNLNILFLDDYDDEVYDLTKVIEKALNRPYKIVAIDSFEEVLTRVKDQTGWSTKKVESWLLKLLTSTAEKYYTAYLVIQQINKGGVFVGSNKLKHNTTGMLYARFDKKGERYIEFEKNRRNGAKVKRKLYFTKDESGELTYDIERFDQDDEILKKVSEEKAQQIEDAKKLDEWLNSQQEDEEEIPSVTDMED